MYICNINFFELEIRYLRLQILFITSHVFLKGTLRSFVRRNFKYSGASIANFIEVIGLQTSLLSAWPFAEFDTLVEISVICIVLLLWLGSFLLQDLFEDLQVLVFKGQSLKYSVNILLTCILLRHRARQFDRNYLHNMLLF